MLEPAPKSRPVRPEGPRTVGLPPHHMSRWAPEQLIALAERCALAAESVDSEPLSSSMAAKYIDHRFADALGGLAANSRLVAKAYRRLALPERRYRRLAGGEYFSDAAPSASVSLPSSEWSE